MRHWNNTQILRGDEGMATPRLVACTISNGDFKDEFYVVVAGSSAFVSRDNVEVPEAPPAGGTIEGRVRAYVITETEAKALIELPGEAVVGGLRTWVPKTQLAGR